MKKIKLAISIFFLLNAVLVFPTDKTKKSPFQEERKEQKEDDGYDQCDALAFLLGLLFFEWYFSE